MAKKRVKQNLGVQVTGRSIAYIQTVGKNGKPGKPKSVVLTTVAVRPQEAAPAPAKRRRR